MVKDSVWQEAFGERGSKKTPEHFFASLEELEKELGRKVRAEDFEFLSANFNDYVLGHLGQSEYAKMLWIFRNRMDAGYEEDKKISPRSYYNWKWTTGELREEFKWRSIRWDR